MDKLGLNDHEMALAQVYPSSMHKRFKGLSSIVHSD